MKGIIVKLPEASEISLNANCFKKMKSLQIFININANFLGEVHYLPNQLRFLDWPGCPLQSLPSSFDPKKLVTFSMHGSRISQLPGGFKVFHSTVIHTRLNLLQLCLAYYCIFLYVFPLAEFPQFEIYEVGRL